MKLLIMPLSYPVITSKYSSQQSVFMLPQTTFFSIHREQIFREETGRQKILNWIISSTPRIRSALNFFVNIISICYWLSQIFDHYHIFEEFLTFVLQFYLEFW